MDDGDPWLAERALSKALKPAVNAVDAQIACIFVPYITAVPISNLPSGGHLWTAVVVCVAGYLATMLIAGYAAQVTAGLMGRGDVVEKCDVVGNVNDDVHDGASSSSSSRQRKNEPATAIAGAVASSTPPAPTPTPPTPTQPIAQQPKKESQSPRLAPELYWLGGAAALAPIGAAMTANTPVTAAVAAAPAYLCVTFAVYLLCRRIPAR